MLQELIHYTAKADQMIIFELIKHTLPQANDLFNHTLNAQHVWACRMLGKEPDFIVWETRNKEDFLDTSNKNIEMLLHIHENIALDANVKYLNTKGKVFVSMVSEILLHVCNHSTHQRGQIAAMFRKADIRPPNTDYILLKRSNKL